MEGMVQERISAQVKYRVLKNLLDYVQKLHFPRSVYALWSSYLKAYPDTERLLRMDTENELRNILEVMLWIALKV